MLFPRFAVVGKVGNAVDMEVVHKGYKVLTTTVNVCSYNQHSKITENNEVESLEFLYQAKLLFSVRNSTIYSGLIRRGIN